MTTVTDTLNLFMPDNGSVWHICRDSDLLVCTGNRIPKQSGTLELGLDRRVVSLRGKRVCGACRRGVR